MAYLQPFEDGNKRTSRLAAMGKPDALRLRYRERLTEVIVLVVANRKSAQAELGLSESTAPGFQAMLLDELKKWEVFNCARYRLTPSTVQAWLDAGRPH